MVKSSEAELEARAALFKALGHPARLLIVNLIRLQPRHGQELAEILGLDPATISHHLKKLSDAGVLRSEKEQYYQTYSLTGEVWGQRLGDLVQLGVTELPEQVEVDAFRAKVLKTFFRHGRLLRLPGQLKKYQVVMEHIAEAFEPGRDYPEQEVNQILWEYNQDVASLRRGLIESKLMEREKGIYRRVMAG
jgi:ArsR family transcriptional regulator, arsenate/arsenite/antimonite-responsive transcriptional repressor